MKSNIFFHKINRIVCIIILLIIITFTASTRAFAGERELRVEEVRQIHRTAAEGNIHELNVLLSRGHNLEAALDESGATPLHTAVKFNRPDVVLRLLYRGADPNVKDNKGKKPIDYARKLGFEPIVTLLENPKPELEKWHKHLRKKLGMAASVGNTSELNRYLNEGIDVNARDERFHETILFRAAARGKIEAIELLLQRGADINARGVNGATVLHRAVFNRRIEAVKFFLSKGFDVNEKNGHGHTPIMYAAHNGGKEMVEFLLSQGANVNSKNRHLENALFAPMSFHSDAEIIELLIKNGIDVNQKNHDGQRAWDLFYTDYIKLKPILRAGGEVSYEDFINLVQSKNRERLVFALQNSPSLQLKLFTPMGILILAVIILFLYGKRKSRKVIDDGE